jgi:hypothetical protein
MILYFMILFPGFILAIRGFWVAACVRRQSIAWQRW